MQKEQEHIIAQIRRYLSDRCTPEEKSHIEKWLLENMDSPGSDAIFEQVISDIEVIRDPAAKERARVRLGTYLGWYDTPIRPNTHRTRQWFAYAVMALAVILLTGVVVWQYRQTAFAELMTEQYAPHGETHRIELPDGSLLWLRGDSRIVYPRKFGKRVRSVYVSGEVYAEIAKDMKKPFIMEGHDVAVRVLGTKFNFKAYLDDSDIELSLLEGSVSLSVTTREAGLQEFLLSSGKMLRVDKTTGESELTDIPPTGTAADANKRRLNFMDQSLSEITVELERAFDVRIIIRDDHLKETRYLASFVNDESLEEILGSLNADNKMVITHHDDVIFISAK